MSETRSAGFEEPRPRHTTDYSSPIVFLSPHFEPARLSDLLGTGPGAGFLQLSGGTLTGPLVLAGLPLADNHAASKAYVDSFQGNFVDAEFDGPVYGRQFGAWAAALGIGGGTLTGTLQLPNGTLAAPALAIGAADGTGFSRSANALVLGIQNTMVLGFFSGSWQSYAQLTMLSNKITQLGDATAAGDALNLRSADARYTPIVPGGFIRALGDTMLGPLYLPAAAPQSDYEAVTRSFVLATTGGMLPTSGGTMSGPLTLSGNPTDDLHAAPRQYVDAQIAAQALFQGTWQVAANDPPLNPPVPAPLHGYSWIAVTADPNVPELPPNNMAGIAGTPIYNGASVIWNDFDGDWDLVQGRGLTLPEADARYLRLAGGSMAGSITFASNNFGFGWPDGSVVFEQSVGLTLRRSFGQNDVWTESASGANRQRMLSAPDLRTAAMIVEPASVTVPGSGVWTTYIDVNYPLTRTGMSRLLISCSINIIYNTNNVLQVNGVRLGIPAGPERRLWTYGISTQGNAAGMFVDLYADVTGPNPRITIQLAALEAGGAPWAFDTIGGAGNQARSQILITDLGPLP